MDTGTEMPIAVLLSGGGTTMQNLIDVRDAGLLPVRIVQVISNKEGAKGIERAKRAKLPVDVVTRKAFSSVDAFSAAIFDRCRQAGAKLVCLAGFLQLLRIPDDFMHRVMNIHPSLLPAFGGKGMYGHHVHDAVLESGVSESGCTVHFADNEFDHGPIILQRTVPVLKNDTADKLAARVFEQECVAYPVAIRAFAEGRITVEGRKVRISL
ncbi:MAG: phosphoribosylglycinamide formyltransferase [Planctomycetes bacterium]|nr:phosphoribosylglycinamide formyltransferase [Planctomycetota bacterium]